MRNGASKCEWRHALEACGGFCEFEKKLVELRTGHRTRRVDFRLLAEVLGRCRTRWGGGVMKKPEYKECVSLSLCRRSFKLKGNKKFRTWTEKTLRVFRISRMLYIYIYIYIYIYKHYMSISHIRIWLCNTPPGQSGPGSDGNKGVLRIPQKLQHCWNLTIRLFSVIYQDTCWGVLTLLQRSSRFILQPQPTGQKQIIDKYQR